jgi:nucleotide-binding universal stress UspA family protein
MKTIIVPTDFSKCAQNALVYALDLALASDARVVLLHVVFPNYNPESNAYEGLWIDDYIAQREKALKDIAHKVSRKPAWKTVRLDTTVTVGFPVPEVVRCAEEIHADMIIMGTTGATGLRGIFLGSTSNGVISRTRIPICTVPTKARFQKDANVVFATDFRMRVDHHSLEVLQSALLAQNGFLKIMHVLDKPGVQPDKSREATLSQKLDGMPHDFHYLHHADVAQAVSNFLDATDASMLITISHDHSLLHRLFYESVTRKLAHRARVPMLVLHDAPPPAAS